MKKKLSELKPGERFIYGGVEWILLDLKCNHAISITADCVYKRAFDRDNVNDWSRSSLRKELNGDFLAMLISEGAEPTAFIEFESDLTSNDGMTDYGTTRDKIALFSCDLYREYRSLLPKTKVGWWTLTPWTNVHGYLYSVCGVEPLGMLHVGTAFKEYGGVRPLCHFSSDILVSVPDEDAETEQSNSVKQAINDMMKILDERPLELWEDIVREVVSYACGRTCTGDTPVR